MAADKQQFISTLNYPNQTNIDKHRLTIQLLRKSAVAKRSGHSPDLHKQIRELALIHYCFNCKTIH